MRFSLAVMAAVVGISVGGWAQQDSSFKVKVTREKPARSTVPPSSSKAGTAASANAKELQNEERQSLKATETRTGQKKVPALKPVREKSSPSINLGGSGGNGKNAGSGIHGVNSLQGRLKQKGGGGGGHQ